MASTANQYAFDLGVALEANRRWRLSQSERRQKQASVGRKQFDDVESKERLAKRANRLINQVRTRLEMAPGTAPPELERLTARGPVAPNEISNLLMERVIGATRDFLSIEFLDRALYTNRSVGRIVTAVGAGRSAYGTGFLVTPRLLLTNHHVLGVPADAAASQVQFNYQLDRIGQPMTIASFRLRPEEFFLSNQELDFALVAVEPTSERGAKLETFGHCPLIGAEGKITIGEPINIIQHPRGEMKQIVIRENRLLDLLDLHVHYEADTDPGSSGSPVFNDQWEVVALHHSGVPKTDDQGNLLDVDGNVWNRGDDPELLAWVGNEGVRVSKLVASVADAPLSEIFGTKKQLRNELLQQSKADPVTAASPTRTNFSSSEIDMSTPNNRLADQSHVASHLISSLNGAVTLTVPLNVTISLGAPPIAPAAVNDQSAEELFQEAVRPDEDYDNRPGYDAEFLGFEVPLPRLGRAIQAQAFRLSKGNGPEAFELKYYHYSVLFNRKRRLAFVSAVNLDAKPHFKHKRQGKDKWYFDPRVPQECQAGEELYAGNPLDRGHLVRRDDAAWGATKEEARLANDDTFHFTNCSPQHEVYNQSGLASRDGLLLWGNLENHVAAEAKSNNKKLSIFNGPVFRSNDRKVEGVQVPKEFFKVVAFQDDEGEPRALAFILSQASLLRDLPEEEFEVGPYEIYQVPVRDLESRTKLNFGPLRNYDPLAHSEQESYFEADLDAVAIDRLERIVTKPAKTAAVK